MQIQQKPPEEPLVALAGRNLWLWWVLTTGAGYSLIALSQMLSLISLGPNAGAGDTGIVVLACFFVASLIITGPAIGITQGIVLSRAFPRWRQLPRAWLSWLGFTFLGSILGPIAVVAIVAMTRESSPDSWTFRMLGILGAIWCGTILGLAQSISLRKYVRVSGWWILAGMLGSVVGTALSWVSVSTVLQTTGNDKLQMALLWVGTWVIYGIVAGAITGLALIKLPHQARQVSPGVPPASYANP